MKLSDEQIYSLFSADLAKGIDTLNKKTNNHYYNLDEGQKEAILDAYFTMGESFGNSDVAKEIANNHLDSAVMGFAKMTNARGKVNPNVCLRRLDEIKMYAKFSPSSCKALEAVDLITHKAHNPKVAQRAKDIKKELSPQCSEKG